MSNTLFVILGVARSGTSAMSRAMKVFGASHSKNLLPCHETNPKGFWEGRVVKCVEILGGVIYG